MTGMPDVVLLDANDHIAGSLEGCGLLEISPLVDERHVESVAVDLEDERQFGIAEVHPTEPGLFVPRVDLAPEPAVPSVV